MLILSRKPNEVITIGDDIRIVVLRMKNGSVKMGVEAPKSVPVDREEIRLRKIAGPATSPPSQAEGV